jgi:hypothetical protein
MQDLLAYRRAHVPSGSANSARETADDPILQTTVLKVSRRMIVMAVSPLRSGADLQSDRDGEQVCSGAPRSFARPASIAAISSPICARYAPTLQSVLFPASAANPCRSAFTVSIASILQSSAGADDLLDCPGHGQRTVRADAAALDI